MNLTALAAWYSREPLEVIRKCTELSFGCRSRANYAITRRFYFFILGQTLSRCEGMDSECHLSWPALPWLSQARST